MRPIRHLTVLAGVASLAAAPAASPATVTLSVAPATGIVRSGTAAGQDVYLFRGTVRTQRFLAALTDDAGAPVTGCLGRGARVRLVDAATGRVRGSARCANADGRFSLVPSTRIRVPTRLVARVDATVPLLSATPVSAAASTPVVVVVQPEIRDTSPATARVNRFPITGRVRTPRADRAGAVALERKRGSRWVRLARRPLPASGVFRFILTTGPGVYRIHFIARAGSGYVDTALGFRIRRTG
jgi:hypothetical protein